MTWQKLGQNNQLQEIKQQKFYIFETMKTLQHWNMTTHYTTAQQL